MFTDCTLMRRMLSTRGMSHLQQVAYYWRLFSFCTLKKYGCFINCLLISALRNEANAGDGEAGLGPYHEHFGVLGDGIHIPEGLDVDPNVMHADEEIANAPYQDPLPARPPGN